MASCLRTVHSCSIHSIRMSHTTRYLRSLRTILVSIIRLLFSLLSRDSRVTNRFTSLSWTTCLRVMTRSSLSIQRLRLVLISKTSRCLMSSNHHRKMNFTNGLGTIERSMPRLRNASKNIWNKTLQGSNKNLQK